MVLIAPKQRGHVAEGNEGVTRPDTPEVHHRISDMGELDVQHCHNPPIEVMELSRVPENGRLSSLIVDSVAGQPSQCKFQKRIGALLEGAIRHFFEMLEPNLIRFLGPDGSYDPGITEFANVQTMHSNQDIDVVLHRPTSLVVRHVFKVVPSRNAVHHNGAGLVTPTVNPRHWDAVVLQYRLKDHFVLKGKRRR